MRLTKGPALRSVLIYTASTILCSIVAKVMVTRFYFDYPIVILMMQSAATLFVVEILRVLGIIKVAPYTFEKGRQLLAPSIAYTISQWITLASFEGIAMPNFDSVKRITPLLILIGTAIRAGKFQASSIDANRTLLIAGIVVASAITVNLDLSLDRYSFLYGIAGATLQAFAYLTFEEKMASFSANEMLYLHSFNSLVFYLLADIIRDEIRDAFIYLITAAHPFFIVVFIISLIIAIVFHWSTFYCLEKLGSLNLQLASNVRAVIETFVAYYLSIYLFYDVYPGIINWIFLVITLIGVKELIEKDAKKEVIKGPWLANA